MPATHAQKVVDHWATSPFLLITLCNGLETEDINCCSVASGSFAHSLVYIRLELLNSPWSLLSDSPLHDAPYSLNRRQASQAHALYAYEATLILNEKFILPFFCCLTPYKL